LSLERTLKRLESFGLSRMDAEVYVYLAKKGPQKGKDLAIALKLSRNQLLSTLKSLQNEGLINAKIGCPALYSALEFEQILNIIIDIKDEEAQAIRKNRNQLISSWGAITREKNNTDT